MRYLTSSRKNFNDAKCCRNCKFSIELYNDDRIYCNLDQDIPKEDTLEWRKEHGMSFHFVCDDFDFTNEIKG